MAFIWFFLFASLLAIIAEAQKGQSNITRGSSLTPTSSPWLSKSGLYAFGFFKQGNNGYAVGIFINGIPEKTVVWTANRNDPPVTSNSTLLFTDKGSLSLLSTTGQKDIGDPLMLASYASMLDSGNFVLYDSDGKIIWQTFDYPTDTLLPTQRLPKNKTLISSISKSNYSEGFFKLSMQQDGNLVLYRIETTPTTPRNAYYSSGTYDKGPNVTLKFDADGSLYLLNRIGLKILNIRKRGYISNNTIRRMTIDEDGVFRVYSYTLIGNSGNWSNEWSPSYDKCNPKGLCGLNAFCVLNVQEVDCKCLPGFEFLNQRNRALGCQRNFIVDSCGNKKEGVSFEIEDVPNTVWEDVPYEVLSSTDIEGCKRACLDDCNCEAAFYKDGSCTKQRLPLKFGKRDQSKSNIALIKVGKPISSSFDEESPAYAGRDGGNPCPSWSKYFSRQNLD